MDAIITIRPFNLENINILSHSPGVPVTSKRFQVDSSISSKLATFNKEKLGTISVDTIHEIDPEYDGLLPSYDTANFIKKLANAVAFAVNNGHPELNISKEEFAKVLDIEISKITDRFQRLMDSKDEIIKNQTNDIRMLKVKQTLYEEVLKQANEEYDSNIKQI